MSHEPIIDAEALADKGWWKPYLVKIECNGITVTIDTDIVFPMVQEEWWPIQPGKKYKIIIKGVEDDE